MEYSNEVKVGITIVLVAVAAVLGVRFFRSVPLFGNTYTMYAQFEDAGGLTSGNPVRMKGVQIGSVKSVQLRKNAQIVRARLQIQGDIQIPEGSDASVSGFSGLGGIHISIKPGPRDNPALSSGAVLTEPPEGSVLERLTDQAPVLASKTDSVLTSTDAVMSALATQLREPKSNLRRTLASMQKITGDLESVTDTGKDDLRVLLKNLRSLSSDLEAFTAENSDSLEVTIRRLNRSLSRLNRSLASFRRTSATLDTITTKLNEGDGTAGRLLNDPSLHTKLDSTATRANRILRDFRRNPGRYLDDMTLVEVF